MTKKASTKSKWIHVHPLNSHEPATEISQAAVIAFRNGLKKFADSNKDYQNNMAGTMVYRCVIDLDHLARIMEVNNNTVSFQCVITPKNKTSAKKMARELRKKNVWKRVK